MPAGLGIRARPVTIVAAPASPPARALRIGRRAGLLAAVAVLGLAVLLSLAVGARQIPFGEVVDALLGTTSTDNPTVVVDVRLPRTELGLLAGAALGLAGALMQALTRNPLADPGLLGVNAGASAAVVTAIGLLGITGSAGYIWFALAGAAVASVLVYAIGSVGRASTIAIRTPTATKGSAIVTSSVPRPRSEPTDHWL